MKLLTQAKYLFTLMVSIISIGSYAESGGPLSPVQASYNVNYYNLDLKINPDTQTINGSLLCQVEIVNSIDTLVLDLDDPFIIDSILIKIN